MKVLVISTADETLARFQAAKANGYITFIYNHADPKREICSDKFVYVGDDAELNEKVRLLEADVIARDEVNRW